MDNKKIIDISIKALKEIKESRFFQTERGYQGRFACALYKHLDQDNIFPDDMIVEIEYQKRIDCHDTRMRPDLIIHIPSDSQDKESRKNNNFVVYQFKKEADYKKAKDDFEKLETLFKKLKYTLGVFVNINKYPEVYLINKDYSVKYKKRIHEFSVGLVEGKVKIRHSFFENGKPKEEDVD